MAKEPQTKKKRRTILSGSRYTDEDRAKWVSLFVGGKSIEEVVDASGAGRHTVYRALKAAGVKLRGNPRSFDRKAILREIKKKKLSQSAIARKYGCSQRLVSDLARGVLEP